METARFSLPVVELQRRLSDLLGEMAVLAEALPDLIWRKPPGDPLPACRTLNVFIDECDRIEEKASLARATAIFLWELAHEETLRRYDIELGSTPPASS